MWDMALKINFVNPIFCRTFAFVIVNYMESTVSYTNTTKTATLPRIKTAKKAAIDIPEGYMPLEQFEKELVKAVSERHYQPRR